VVGFGKFSNYLRAEIKGNVGENLIWLGGWCQVKDAAGDNFDIVDVAKILPELEECLGFDLNGNYFFAPSSENTGDDATACTEIIYCIVFANVRMSN
jgi:hypothetical protein